MILSRRLIELNDIIKHAKMNYAFTLAECESESDFGCCPTLILVKLFYGLKKISYFNFYSVFSLIS